MHNYIEDRLQQIMSEDTPFVRVSACATEDDKWDDEGGADVSICIRQPWLWHVMGILRGPYYYLRDHGIMAPEIAFHINEPDLLTDGEHMGYQRCGDVVGDVLLVPVGPDADAAEGVLITPDGPVVPVAGDFPVPEVDGAAQRLGQVGLDPLFRAAHSRTSSQWTRTPRGSSSNTS